MLVLTLPYPGTRMAIVPTCVCVHTQEVFDPDMPAGEVSIEHGEFAWDATEAKPTLTDINLQAKPGTLTMIVGGVGSGKSSVLGALVGHMTKRTGKIRMGGSVAYVAQSVSYTHTHTHTHTWAIARAHTRAVCDSATLSRRAQACCCLHG